MLAFAVAIFVRGDIQRLKSVRITTFFLSTFLSYTIAKYYLEADAEHRFNKLPVEPQDIFRFSIDVEAREVVAGQQPWEAPAVRVFYRDPNGETLDGVVVVRLYQSEDFSRFSEILHVPDGASRAEISISLIKSAGSLAVRNTTISRVVESDVYQKRKTILLVIWIVTIVLATALPVHRLPSKQKAILVLMGVAILFGVLLPESMLLPSMNFFYEFVPSTVWIHIESFVGKMSTTVNGDVPTAVVSKLGHMFVFFLFGLIVRFCHCFSPTPS